MTEINIPISPIMFVVLTLALATLLLWLKNKEFRYSKSIKIILYLIMICFGIIYLLGIVAFFSPVTATLIILGLIWIALLIKN